MRRVVDEVAPASLPLGRRRYVRNQDTIKAWVASTSITG
jgi:hypothetical protein